LKKLQLGTFLRNPDPNEENPKNPRIQNENPNDFSVQDLARG